MGLLDRLKPQPRWKHADPAVRLAAVAEVDDPVELAGLAETDPDPRVRRAAAALLSDTESLGRLCSRDPDADVRERAADRLVALATEAPQVPSPEAGAPAPAVDPLAAVAALADARRLSTIAKSEAPEAVRQAALDRIADDRALGSIARHAKAESTAARAVAKLADPAELLDVALHSDHRDVALAAFERVAASPLDIPQLRSIEVRAHQKAVSRRARAMIQELEHAEAQRHAAALDRQRREGMLHDAVLQLADVTDVEVARGDLARLTDAWTALGVTEPASIERFTQAVEAAEAAIARRTREAEEAAEHERLRREAIATRETLCARVETLEGDDVLAQLVPIEEEWRSLLPLVGNGPEADRLAERFAHAVAACRKRHEMSAVLADARGRLDALVAEAETLPSIEDADAAAARWHALSREARGLTALFQEAGRPTDAWTTPLSAVDQVFADREAARRAEADEAVRAMVVQISRLGDRAKRVADAETITLREGERLMRDVTAALETAGRAGTSPDLEAAVKRLRDLQEQVAPRVRELRELDEWRRFANAQRQEQLITMAEAIVASLEAEEEAGKPSDLAATAKALRELHAEWQQVAEAPRQQAQRLWDRFKLATDFIRSRCEVHFKKIREERQADLEKKTAIVAEAESLAESTDWAKTAGRLQELQAEWQTLGRVNRDAERELGQRFRAACNTFFTRRREDLADRKKVWTENLARKEALCERAEALALSTDWDTAAAEMKRLQAEWKTVGPVRKNRSEAVWNRFRTAADRFFERYHSRHEIALAGKLAEREAIVVELEQLAAAPSEAADLGQQVQNLRTTWHRSVPVPVPGMKDLNDRWQAALAAILNARPDAFAGTDLDPSAVVHRMEKLVARVEGLLEGADDAAPSEPVSQTELLAARLRSAFANNAMGGRGSDDSKWRAANDAMKDAQAAWRRLPPIDVPEAHALEIRFREACRRVQDHVRRHRQPAQQPSQDRPPRREAAAV